jgi:cyclopropane fatty-acyl-phospholipid synthase-like methyltransferase
MTPNANFWDQRAETTPYIWTKAPSIVGIKGVEPLKTAEAKTVLDIGCGYGRDTVYLAKQGFQVTGIDFSKEMIAQGEKWAKEESLNIAFIVDNFTTHNFTETYDAAVSFNCLHLLAKDQRKQYVKKLYDLLNPGGIFVTANFSTKESKYRQGEEVEPNTFTRNGKIVHYFTEEELRELFSGFNIVSITQEQAEEEHEDQGKHTHNEYLLIAKKEE